MKYGFIGTGCMGGALATACAKAIGPEDILLSNRSPEKAQALAEKLGAIPAVTPSARPMIYAIQKNPTAQFWARRRKIWR